MMKTKNHYLATRKPSPAYLRGAALRTTILSAPFALLGLAGAQTSDPLADLNSKASTGVSGIVTTVGAVAGIALTIALIVWGVRHLKPKG